MFGDGKGLASEIKFAVGAAYDSFAEKWGTLPIKKIGWVDIWSDCLSEFDVATINAAANYCLENLSRAPALTVFRIYCRRVQNDEPLADPVLSREERIARAILELDSIKLGYSGFSELADACLIAAAIASANANKEFGLPWDKNSVAIQFVGRSRMFGEESLFWQAEARLGRGNWIDLLG